MQMKPKINTKILITAKIISRQTFETFKSNVCGLPYDMEILHIPKEGLILY